MFDQCYYASDGGRSIHYEKSELAVTSAASAAARKVDRTGMYKRMIILVRSIYSFLRMLPSNPVRAVLPCDRINKRIALCSCSAWRKMLFRTTRSARCALLALLNNASRQEANFAFDYSLIAITPESKTPAMFDTPPANFVFSSIATTSGTICD